MKKRLTVIALLAALGFLLLAPLVRLLEGGSESQLDCEVASMSIDTPNEEQRRLMSVFGTRKIPFKLHIDSARVAHFSVPRQHMKKARAGLAEEMEKGLKVTIK